MRADRLARLHHRTNTVTPKFLAQPRFQQVGLPWLIAAAAWLVIFLHTDPAGDYPSSLTGPGETLDEVFNVQQGVYLAEAVKAYHLALLDPQSAREVFDPAIYNPDHPPLGRLWLGVHHQLTRSCFPPSHHPSPFVTACARTGSATAFALSLGLLGMIVIRWYGVPAGVAASLSLILMPRLFGHAHLASLETVLGLTYLAAVLGIAVSWNGEKPPRARTAAWTGALWGLVLLTKIQAVLLPVPVAVWAIWRWRQRAIPVVLIWGATGLAAFFIGWPWLWQAPLTLGWEYFSRATERVVLHVWYLGERIADRDVPWHYPWVMFLTTVPVGMQLLGGWGAVEAVRERKADARPILILACLLFVLLVFSLPGVAVYDGCRLFLVVFPLWGVLIGLGAKKLWVVLGRRMSVRNAAVLLGVGLAVQSWGLWEMRPCYLSYHNLLVGGARGARYLGFEATYWGDSLTRDFLREVAEVVPQGSRVDVVPVLHPLQLDDLLEQSPILRQHGIRLGSWQPDGTDSAEYVLEFCRKADLPAEWPALTKDWELQRELCRGGTRLAALYRR